MFSATMEQHPEVVCVKYGSKVWGKWKAVAFPALQNLSVAVGE
jgi:hypothetical protein